MSFEEEFGQNITPTAPNTTGAEYGTRCDNPDTVRRICESMGIPFVENGKIAVIVKKDYFFEISLLNGKVYVIQKRPPYKKAIVCLQLDIRKGFGGWIHSPSNNSLTMNDIVILSRIVQIATDSILSNIQGQIDAFVEFGTFGSNVYQESDTERLSEQDLVFDDLRSEFSEGLQRTLERLSTEFPEQESFGTAYELHEIMRHESVYLRKIFEKPSFNKPKSKIK